MAGEGLRDDKHGVGSDAAEDGGSDDPPEFLGLDPDPVG